MNNIKELTQLLEEGKKIFLDGIWYRKIEGELVEENVVIKNFDEITKCPLCGEDILTEQDRESFIVLGCCLACYYHKQRI